ncbi:hypothetical protein Daura_13780 [Dactylosporangium aurantiacum]|uniref:Uncharacterized protein n=1 Tax=Dactylosporangium aurantiacum TaxID=35754 RepID=A0A9Q9IPW1_9ACTN|nr:hypothetical protein [Dactylosporangium aurantiacum]MDG6105518.1 hypothetical protein [Dactylosporangium aurantiacum]UWZ57135.1 hypothetical protein Daura_13780 [Dactylosporangium aurantiacum]
MPTGPVALHDLRFLDEGDRVVVGRTDCDSYGVFPPDGAALLRELAGGRPPQDAAAWYTDRYGEPVDIDEFLDTLRELSFVNTGDAGTAAPPRWQRLGAALFSPAAWVCYGALVAAAVAVCVADPRLVPARGHVFFTDYLLVVELTLLFGQLPFVVLHELFHLLAGRRLGLHSSMHLGHRLYFLVAETKLDGLVVVPRRQRYLPILAGVVADVLAACALTVVAWLSRHPDGTLPVAGRACLAIAFMCLLGVLAQLYFFLRTDVYHLVTTVLGCVDLHTTARQLLHNRLWRLLGRTDRLADETRWDPRDAAAARWYAPLYAAGYAAMLAVLVSVALPLAWRFLGTAVAAVTDPAVPAARFWDALLFLAASAGQLVLAAALAVRDRRRNRQH